MTESSDNTSNSNGIPRTKKFQLDPEFLPANKHAPTPLEKQRAQVAKLLQNPTREIHLPKAPREKSIRPPREMMKNVQGSSAGAGSGEFHVYKQSRRREYERLRLMDEDEEKGRIKAEFEKKQEELKKLAESKTNKNRLKRQKKKENIRKKKDEQKTGNKEEHLIGDKGTDGKEEQVSNSDDDDDDDLNSEVGGNDHHLNKKKRKKLGAAPIAEGMVFKKPNLNDDDNYDEGDVDQNPTLGRLDDSKETSDNNNLLTSVPVVESVGLTIVEDD